ncbi:MAG: sigma 54-interacting transcriptional regulator [Desulfobacterales bacterium]|nr:sigma 54-interacting transcriptional regulator [Desulfobacterales bacterium]
MDPGLPDIVGSEDQLQQVFMNLISNAAQAMEAQGGRRAAHRNPATRPKESVVMVKFKDSGIGIPEEDISKLFEPFFTTRKRKGVGLGLSVVYGIIQEHGGSIYVQSKVGEGATFASRTPPSAPSPQVFIRKEVVVSSAKILIVDDETIVRESLAGWLERDGHQVQIGPQRRGRSRKSAPKPASTFFCVDIKMEGMSGLEVLRRIKEADPEVAVVMITAYGSIATRHRGHEERRLRLHAQTLRPQRTGRPGRKDHPAPGNRHAKTSILKEQFKERTRFESMIGQSEPMQKIFSLICDVAPTDATVLILGETGTGKGLAAKAIHSNSPRRDGPYVVVNCGAIPEHLMESELFGHQRGAFTDAKETKKGRLELAHGGTLFLDEIGEIGVRMQIDLLRVLEDRVFYRVGGTQPIEADFRVLAATNRRLEQLIREGKFREDLVLPPERRLLRPCRP